MNQELEATFLSGLEQNKQRLLRICFSYSDNEEDRKDLFQEVLINIWKSMPSFKGDAKISTWMYRVTLNVCLNSRTKLNRKKKRFVNMDSVELSRYGGAAESTIESQEVVNLRSCISTLNEVEAGIITLYLEELPYREIAQIIGITENHVAVKIKRIKNKLLNCIKARS